MRHGARRWTPVRPVDCAQAHDPVTGTAELLVDRLGTRRTDDRHPALPALAPCAAARAWPERRHSRHPNSTIGAESIRPRERPARPGSRHHRSLNGAHRDCDRHVRGRTCASSPDGACAVRPTACMHRSGQRSRDCQMSPHTPPFTDEHDSCGHPRAGSSNASSPRTHSSGRRSAGSPTRSSPSWPPRACLGLKYPESYGGQGGDYLHEAVLCEEMARAGSGGTAAGIGAHINIATPPIWKFGTEEQKQRYLVPAIARRADRRARHHRAGSRLGRGRHHHPRRARGRRLGGERREDLHHQRRPRPLHRDRRQDHPGGRPPRDLVPDRRPRRGGRVLGSCEKLGWHASDTATISFQDVFVPEENLLGELQRGLQADHGQLPVGAPGDGAGGGRRDDARVGAHRRLRPRAPGLRAPAVRAPGDPPQARRPRHLGVHLPLRHLRRPAPLRRRRGAAEGGHDGQAAHPARVPSS